ncbi:MAG: hypothetical protein AB8I08_27210 [Sandaracinaceae bacterium]
MGKDKIGFGLGGCGFLLVFLCFCSMCFWGWHTLIEPGGAISGDEAAPAFGGSCCCLFISFLIAAGGIGFGIKAKKDSAAPPA